MLVIKTTAAQVNALETRLVELHPYDVPELLSIQVTGGHQPYIAWVSSEVEG
jgi:periplasmic divalent cation tolerance protein